MARLIKYTLYTVDRKLWFVSENFFKIKYVIDGTTRIVGYDISGVARGVNYKARGSVSVNNIFRGLNSHIEGDSETIQLGSGISTFIGLGHQIEQITRELPTSDTDYPFYFYVNTDEGETETDEPATIFYQFPPPETMTQWRERVQPRVTQIANRLVLGLPHNLVHFGAKSEAICNDVDSRHHLIDRYDNAVNSTKPFIGYIQQMLDAATEPDPVIEGLVEELEEATPDTIDEMPKLFRKQAFDEWSQTLYYFKVRAGMDLATGLPRRLVYDIGAQEHNIIPMDPPVEDSGEIDREKAGREFHVLSADCFNDAQLSEHDELVTERIVVPLEYTPDDE